MLGREIASGAAEANEKLTCGEGLAKSPALTPFRKRQPAGAGRGSRRKRREIGSDKPPQLVEPGRGPDWGREQEALGKQTC